MTGKVEPLESQEATENTAEAPHPSKAWTTPKVRATGRRLLIFTNGTRGDVQPIAAVSLGWKRAGSIVKLLTNGNHVELLRSMELDAAGVSGDLEAQIKEDAELQEAIGRGDIELWLRKAKESHEKFFPGTLAKKIKEAKEFKPDIIFAGLLDEFEASAIAGAMGVPFVFIPLQMARASRDFATSVLRHPRCRPHNIIGTKMMHFWWSVEHSGKAEQLVKQLPESKEFIAHTEREYMLQAYHPIQPILIGYSPSLYSIPHDWSEDLQDRTKIVGFWIIPKGAQEQKREGGDPLFGGSDRARLDAFLAQGDPPVYLGWGSMVAQSGEEMAGLAVGALRQAGLRGVVLGGNAGLEASLLQAQADGEALMAYAAKHVLFVRTAAHEWLFPQCCALVHHGGSGTTAAAVRSGVPSVVTPCAFDQFDNARIVQNNGAGIALKQISKVTPADLAAALKRCTADQKLIASARRMGERLRSEDGVEAAVRALDDFIVEELDTGRWQANFQDRLEELRELRSRPRRCCSKGRWWGHMCCSSNPNDYSVKVPQRGKLLT